MAEKPHLSLATIPDALDLRGVVDIFRRLTGREPTEAEIAEARDELERGQVDDAPVLSAGRAAKPIEWQRDDDPDPDDEELPTTDPALVAMLGFDPKDLDKI